MRSLYEIGDDLSALEELLTDTDGEIPEGEIGAAIEEWFDRLGEERDEKIRRYCALIAMMTFGAENCEEEARRLGKLKRANENGAKRLKDRLKAFFEAHGIQKLDLRTFKPRIQVNSNAPLILPPQWQSEPASAPEAFHKVTIELNTLAIKEALGGGMKLCPKCGETIIHANGHPTLAADAPETIDSDAAPIALCESCRWTGEPTDTARLGERGSHLRIR